jgi:hypothetical protein
MESAKLLYATHFSGPKLIIATCPDTRSTSFAI